MDEGLNADNTLQSSHCAVQRPGNREVTMYLYEIQMLYYLKAKYIAKTETALGMEQVELTDKHAVHTEAVEHSSWCRARFHPCTSTPLLMASGRGTLPAATRQTLAQGTRLCCELKLCLHKSCTRSSALVWAAQGEGGRDGRGGITHPPSVQNTGGSGRLGNSHLPSVLWTPSASSFTLSSRRSKFWTNKATTWPST